MARSRALLLAISFVTLLLASCAGTSASSRATSTAAALTAVAMLTPTRTPLDTSAYPAGSVGYAISWPQCGGPYPDEPFDFAIIGVTYGWARSENPCFADEYRWAQRGRYHPSVYMNMNYDETAGASRDTDACELNASCRAYQYGRGAAQAAYEYAASVNGVAPVWWLDVQIVSDWSNDLTLNAASVRGAAEFLRSKGIRVGISSTAYQWETAAGEAQHNMPVWDASALDAEMAEAFCREGKDFGGGGTEQIAYVADGFETVVACGAAKLATPQTASRWRE